MQVVVRKPELEEFINEQVNGGHFRSPAEVVEAALEKLRQGNAPEELDDETYQQVVNANERIDRGEGYSVEQARNILQKKMSR